MYLIAAGLNPALLGWLVLLSDCYDVQNGPSVDHTHG